MGVVVADQMDAFRKNMPVVTTCAQTGVTLTSTDGFVEHDDAHATFEALADEFVKQVGGYEAIALLPTSDGLYKFSDRVIETKWRAYHVERAKLRLVTSPTHWEEPAYPFDPVVSAVACEST